MHIGMGTGFAHQRGHDYPDARFMREEFENIVLAEAALHYAEAQRNGFNQVGRGNPELE